MNFFRILTLVCLLGAAVMTETACRASLAAADKDAITDLAERAQALMAREEKVRAKRKELDEVTNKILEKERLAAAEVQRLNGIGAPTKDQKGQAAAATQQWQEAREEMKEKLKELEPRVAELAAEEKALNADKAKLQAAAKEEADRLASEKKIEKKKP